MSEPARRGLRRGWRGGARRPSWMGWSVVVIAVAAIAVAAGASDRGAGVRVPPAIDIGSGVAAHPDAPASTAPPAPVAHGTTTTTTAKPATSLAPLDPAPPTTSLRTSHPTVATTPPTGGAVPTPGSASDQSGSGHDGGKDDGGSPTTVAPNYPVITGTPTSDTASGGSDS